MQIRCNFPDISYLSETQKNNFQFLIKLQYWLSNCDHMNKSFILSYQTGNAHNSQKWHYFQLNMAKYVIQDFGKYNIMLNSFVTFL